MSITVTRESAGGLVDVVCKIDHREGFILIRRGDDTESEFKSRIKCELEKIAERMAQIEIAEREAMESLKWN